MRDAAARMLYLKHIINLKQEHNVVNTSWPGGGLTGPLWRAEGALYAHRTGSLYVMVGVVVADQLMCQLLAWIK